MQEQAKELLENLSRLHTTELGFLRVKKNLGLETEDVIGWCREQILDSKAVIVREGKNWYVSVGGNELTINAYSYTVITAHKQKGI
ncbi:MAG: DUF3781 domain-containing protein [Clostridiales bacterium]|nr:DUF3781 domain-containing protein [Clostridiales bacterium]